MKNSLTKIEAIGMDFEENIYPRIINWCDDETDAIGWIVMHNLVNDISGGGLFMHNQATLQEVNDIALTMSYKNSLQVPIFGGSKAGIRFDHKDSRARDVVKRFLVSNRKLLSEIWTTGGDLNVANDMIEQIVQKDVGLPSAFFSLSNMLNRVMGIPSQINQMTNRLSFALNQYFTLGQSVTGYSVAETIARFSQGIPKVMIQGFGTVGSSLAYFLARHNIAKIVGICEVDGYIYSNKGIDVFQLLDSKKLLQQKSHTPFSNLLTSQMKKDYNWTPRKEDESSEYQLCTFLSKQYAEIFSPCANRYCVTQSVLDAFQEVANNSPENHSPERFIIPGANNIFPSKFPYDELKKYNFYYIPEWVANCGNALLFLEVLKQEELNLKQAENILLTIRSRLNDFIDLALKKCHFNKAEFAESCIHIAKSRIGVGDVSEN